MKKWEIQIIKGTFERCFGLKDCLKSEDARTAEAAKEALAQQSGIRLSFVNEYINEIKEL